MDIKFFDLESDDLKTVKSLLRDQGVITCRDQFSKTFISDRINEFSFGFYARAPIAMIGQRIRKKSDSLFLEAFILCKVPHNYPDEIVISLLCSRNSQKQLGTVLLDKVEDFCRENNIHKIVLNAISEDKLVNWYKQKGFEIIDTTYLPGIGKPKVYLMYKGVM